MGQFLVVVSGLGIFTSLGILIISFLLKLVFLLAKKSEKVKKANKALKTWMIVFCGCIITFIATMVLGPKLDPVGWCSHEYKPISRIEATCEEAGELLEKCELCGHEKTDVIPLNAHSWKVVSTEEATCKTPKQILSKCSTCGVESIENIGETIEHTWSESKIISATCMNPKQIVYTCSMCNEINSVSEGDKAEHSFGEWIVEKEPTTEEKGKRYKFCSVCEYTLTENVLKISPITILSRTYDKDFLGGVEWTFEIKNNSDKVIKYITLKWNCYNAVGDLIYDEITGDNSKGIKITGPLKSGKIQRYTNASKFYNYTYASSTITTIIVEYMDGETVNITSKEYDNIFG